MYGVDNDTILEGMDAIGNLKMKGRSFEGVSFFVDIRTIIK